MPLSLLLVLSSILFAVQGLILARSAALRRAVLRPHSAGIAVVLAALACAASATVRTSGASGTGTRTSYGFPKPFYFTWTSWEHPVSHAGFNWLYLAGNAISWLAFVSLALLLWAAWAAPGRRAAPSTTT